MKVYYKKDHHVILSFGSNEMRQALGVLKAIGKYFKAPFIMDAAKDLERDLAQPKLGYVMHTKICENCCMEIDLRKQSYIHADETYYHQICPTLKEREE